MLETPEERIELLRTGFMQKQLEEMYVKSNDFKIVSIPIVIDIVEVEAGPYKNKCETAVESAHSLGLVVASIFNVSRFERISPMIQ